MAFSKAHLYPVSLKRVSNFGKVICHPERLQIMRVLLKYGGCTVAQLKSRSPLSGPTLSQHLKILRAHEVVTYIEIGPMILYQLNWDELTEAKRALDVFYEDFE